MVISQKNCEKFAQMKKKFWGYNPYKGFFLGSKSTVFGLGLSELESVLMQVTKQQQDCIYMYVCMYV
jgi:hypothetical protein